MQNKSEGHKNSNKRLFRILLVDQGSLILKIYHQLFN